NKTFQELRVQRVELEGMVLKPNMAISGKKCAKQASVAEVAEKTVRMLRACVPAAVPGIAFLSGGQSDEEATAHLDAMNKSGHPPGPADFPQEVAAEAAATEGRGGQTEKCRARPARLCAPRHYERAPQKGRRGARPEKEGGLSLPPKPPPPHPAPRLYL